MAQSEDRKKLRELSDTIKRKREELGRLIEKQKALRAKIQADRSAEQA